MSTMKIFAILILSVVFLLPAGAAVFPELATVSDLARIEPPSRFTSDLPIMVVENFGAGAIPRPGAAFQAAWLFVFEVDKTTGRSSLARGPDASMRIGIRRRGQSSAGFPKGQYRVELWDESGGQIDYPLLDLPSESDWVFNGPYPDKALIRNPMAFALGRAIGMEAPRTRHFEMFLSTNGGTLTSSEYVGVYVLIESIKLSKNRTDLTRLESTDNTEPQISGGYMMRFEPPGIANDGPRATGWNSVEIVEPEEPTVAQRNWIGSYLTNFAATLGWVRGQANNTGVPNNDPLTGYPAFIDVDSFVNLLVINELLREQDSYVRSDYMFKDRDGKLHKGPLWDYNLIAGTGCCFDNRNPMGWQYQQDYNRGGRDHGYEPDWFVPLLRDPDFRQAFIDRWSQLRAHGILETSQLFDLIDSLADPLYESSVRNFIKWDNLRNSSVGFPTPVSNTWPEQIDAIKAWLTQRLAWIDGQFPKAPTFTPGTGVVAPGTDVTLGTAQGWICYTLDGSDPRLPGNAIDPDALVLGTPIAPTTMTFVSRDADNMQVLYPTTSGPGPTAWTTADFNAADWRMGRNGVGYEDTPADYAGLIHIDVGNKSKAQPHSIYVRYPFTVRDPVSVDVLTLRVNYDDGFVAYLNGTRIAARNAPTGVPAWNSGTTGDHVDSAALVAEEIDVSDSCHYLARGSNVLAVHLLNNGGTPNASNTGCTSSDMLLIAELVASHTSAVNTAVTVQNTMALTARSYDGTNWSMPVTATYIVGTPAQAGNLAVTELNYHPADPNAAELAADPTCGDDDFEFIELRNISSGRIDLAGISFVEGIAFTMPAPMTLDAGERIVLVEDKAAFALRYGADRAVGGVYTKKLSNDGETLTLRDFMGNDIFRFTFNDTWYRRTDGQGYTLVLRDQDHVPGDYSNAGSWTISSEILGSPGQ